MPFQLKPRFTSHLLKSPLVSLATSKTVKRSLVSRILFKKEKKALSTSDASTPPPAPAQPLAIDITYDFAPSPTIDIDVSLISVTSASTPEPSNISSIGDTTLVAPASPAYPCPSSQPKLSHKDISFRTRPQGKHAVQLDECVARLKDEKLLRLERALEKTLEQMALKDKQITEGQDEIARGEKIIAGLVRAVDERDERNSKLWIQVEQSKAQERRSEQKVVQLEMELMHAKDVVAKWKEVAAQSKKELTQAKEELAQAKEELMEAEECFAIAVENRDQVLAAARMGVAKIKRLETSIMSCREQVLGVQENADESWERAEEWKERAAEWQERAAEWKERAEESERRKKESDESLEAQTVRAERAEKVLEKYWSEKESSVGATEKKCVSFELEPESQVLAV